MKPKTKLQKRIVELSSEIPGLSGAQFNWAKDNCFKTKGYLRTKTIWCLECGENFQPGNGMHAMICGNECPHCGKVLNVTRCNNRKYHESWYFTIFTIAGEFQVLRHFVVDKYCKVGYPAEFKAQECVQNWISPEGKMTNVARSTIMSVYYDLWNYCSPLEIRATPAYEYKYDIHSAYIYPKKRIIPELKRNGFKGGLHKVSPYTLLPGLLTNPKLETLIKAKQYSLLKQFARAGSKIERYWDPIKICIRNKYKIADASIWCDYIDLLQFFGKDVRNAHYVCPKDLKDAHDRLIEKRRQFQMQEEKEKKMKQAEEYEALYKEFIQRFLGLSISDGEILIEPLKSVSEFIQEGDELHHCVFTNEYFNREDTLILSAKISGQRVETIQFDLKNMDVVQSRGLFNKNTIYHEEILKIVDQNKHLIQQCKRRELNVEHSSKAV